MKHPCLRVLATIALVAGLLAGSAAPAAACSCAEMNFDEQLAAADLAFVGSLVERGPEDLMVVVEYRFAVELWLAGPETGSEVVVVAPSQGSACGFVLALGERAVVFAQRSSVGRYVGGQCGTVPVPSEPPTGRVPLAPDPTGGRQVEPTVTTPPPAALGEDLAVPESDSGSRAWPWVAAEVAALGLAVSVHAATRPGRRDRPTSRR